MDRPATPPETATEQVNNEADDQEKEREYLEVLNRNWKSRTRDIADVLTEMEEWLKSKPDDAVSIVACPLYSRCHDSTTAPNTAEDQGSLPRAP